MQIKKDYYQAMTVKIDFVDVDKDVQNILDVYSEYIDTNITFEYRLPCFDEMKERIEKIIEKYPYLVLRCGDDVVGYAYAHEIFSRPAYQFDAEATIYISREYRGKGYSRLLYEKLFEYLEKMGIRNLYALVTAVNSRSLSFHKKLGFVPFATFEDVGYKNSAWLAVIWLRKILLPFSSDPGDVIPFSKLH